MLKKPANHRDIINDVYDNTKSRLRVDAELEVSDIQIGAVEIKDSVTDDRLKVNPDGSINVNTGGSTTSDSYIVFNQLDINAGTTSEIISYTPLNDSKLSQIIIGGDNDGTFSIYKNGSPVGVLRNTASSPNVSVNFDNFSVLSTDILSVDVNNNSSEQNSYEVTLIFK